MCNRRLYNGTLLAWFSYYFVFGLNLVWLMSGCVYLLLDSDVCGKFNAMWNYGLFTLIVTVLAPVLGSTYVMVTKDIHYDRSVYEHIPAAFTTMSIADQIYNTYRYYEGYEDIVGQQLLFQSLLVVTLSYVMVIIYGLVIFIGYDTCSDLKDTALYAWIVVTLTFCILYNSFFCGIIIWGDNSDKRGAYRNVDTSIDEEVQNARL